MFAPAQSDMPIDPYLKGEWAIYLILIALVVGVIMIVLLTIAWRRYNQRIDQSQHRSPRDDTDVWREAAGRWREDDSDQTDDDDDDDDDQRQLDR